METDTVTDTAAVGLRVVGDVDVVVVTLGFTTMGASTAGAAALSHWKNGCYRRRGCHRKGVVLSTDDTHNQRADMMRSIKHMYT